MKAGRKPRVWRGWARESADGVVAADYAGVPLLYATRGVALAVVAGVEFGCRAVRVEIREVPARGAK